MRTRSFTRIFEGVVSVLLGSGLVSCGGTEASSPANPNAPPDPGGVCNSPSYAATAMNEVGLPATVDYAEEHINGQPSDPLQKVGTPCKTATNPQTCLKTLATITPSGSFPQPSNGVLGSTYVAYTRADQVGTVATDADFVALPRCSVRRDAKGGQRPLERARHLWNRPQTGGLCSVRARRTGRGCRGGLLGTRGRARGGKCLRLSEAPS